MQGGPGEASFFQQLDEDSKEWRSPADFYLEPDTVTRGLTLAGVDVPPPDSSFKGLADVDYYREPVPVSKALASCLNPDNVEYSGLACSAPDYSTARFSEANCPPCAPADVFFKFTLTTLLILSHMPHEIGNHLLDFFTQQVVSTLTKVNRVKFSFKADVFENYAMCTMKVRVFQEREHFAIEFQRRKGDAIAFNNVFKQACRYLKSIPFSIVPNAGEEPKMASFAPPPLPGQQVSSVDEAAAVLAPLLDIAKLTTAPRLQAEAAAGLATMAEDETLARQMCKEHIFKDVKMLFYASAPEVDYPTARLTRLLAQQQEAATHFAHQSFLPLMVEKVRSVTTCAKAREELASALSAAAQHQSRTTLPQEDQVELARTLSECIAEISDRSGNDMIVQNLQAAQIALSSW